MAEFTSREILSSVIIVALVLSVILASEYDLVGKGYAFVGKSKLDLPANLPPPLQDQPSGRGYAEEIPPTSTSPKTGTEQKHCGCIAEVSVTYTCTPVDAKGKPLPPRSTPCNRMRFYGPTESVTCKVPKDCTTTCNNFVSSLQNNLPRDQAVSKCQPPNLARAQEYQATMSQWSNNENVCKEVKNTRKVSLLPPITCS